MKASPWQKRGPLAALSLLLLSTLAEATTVRVHYDVGYGNRVTIRGSKSPLSWTTGINATWSAGNIWTLSWSNSAGDVEIKPLVNDTVWSTGANYRIKAGATVELYPFFGPASGRLQYVSNVYSPQLGNSRTLAVYLPPSYSENPLKRYPVLYAHDGQNLFNASTAFGGVEWRMDETANALIGNGSMDEVIIVGVYNAEAHRIYEYTPCCDSQYGGGGADKYERFLIDTVKPYVDQNFRTLTGKQNTALLGSSLGGLVSFYVGRRNPSVFGKLAALSSSFWWNNQTLTQQVEVSPTKVEVNVYLDAGTSGDGLTETTRMRDALVADGHLQGGDLFYYVAQGAGHNESAWAARLNLPLTYLFPWQGTAY
ncbi:alpha/beta hydrolase-fold protein [Stigmatella sp. ncwal1]|uniref:Alpha/beta hydrolase-fold protein n=1 Tax=Stigmatella ashevillensis TaxID=2995309 RepID=A0ABT5DHN1_9BACT|nr:alpha/beta hydrolase-fold protein [Stigmatella ashevillena]MDC0713160.1 alpha/beta hydrolase-fold protein [Stigmatella ashevillena]